MGDLGFLFPILFVIAGAAVGSFLNVCADRLPAGRSIVWTRSECDTCSKILGGLDLIPIVSYLWLRGRCRYCGAAIPLRLPVVEAVTAAVYGLIWVQAEVAAQLIIYAVHASLLILVAEIDVTHRLILNKITYPWAALALGLSPFLPNVGIRSALAGGLVAFALFGVIYALSRGGMGFGDVKLAGVIGLMLGLSMMPVALVVGSVGGGLAGAMLLLLRLKGRKDPLPYGVFLSCGGGVALLWGSELWETYVGWVLRA